MSVLVIYKVKGREIPHARKERETFTGMPSTHAGSTGAALCCCGERWMEPGGEQGSGPWRHGFSSGVVLKRPTAPSGPAVCTG